VERWSIRPYAGTLAEARGILAVEQRTFGECPYAPEELQARLGAPESHVVLAEAAGQVIGFVAGLRTAGLCGPRLEADLLAVDPSWQRQGIATALLTALRRTAGGVQALRGVVRPDNPASERAFARAGFQPSAETYGLMIYRILGFVPRPLPAWSGEVRPLAGAHEAAALAALAPEALPPAGDILAAAQRPGVTVLVATKTPDRSAETCQVSAAVELLEVHTLLYSGLWLERALAARGQVAALRTLIAAAVEEAKRRELDEVGCLAPRADRRLREALRGEGFVPLDCYRAWLAAPCETAP